VFYAVDRYIPVYDSFFDLSFCSTKKT